MKYELRRFPKMSCQGRDFDVALKSARFGEVCKTPDEACQPGGYYWETRVTVSGTVFPKWMDYELHPLLKFLKDHPSSIPRHSVYIHLPESLEVMIAAWSTTSEKNISRFELIGHIAPNSYVTVDSESYEDFDAYPGFSFGESKIDFNVRNFYLRGDL